MNIRRKAALWFMLLLCAITCMLEFVPVYAADENHRITFHCANTDGKVIMEGEKLYIYRIADENQNILDEFSAVAYTDNEPVYAANLLKHAQTNGIKPIETMTADAAGNTVYEAEDGTFLIAGDDIKKKDVTYTPIPFLLKIDNTVKTEFTCYIKYKSNEEKPPIGPKTGDPSRTSDYLVMLILSLSIILLTVSIMIKRRKKNDE